MTLKLKEKGDLVRELQVRLKEFGHDPGAIDSDFGPKTEKALLAFQKEKNLKADGVVGPVTAGALGIDEFIKIPELERRQFSELLLANPNYFGNYPDLGFKPVKKMVGNTKYEEIGCLGFNPKLDMLEATVQVKLPYGYKGGLCTKGSTEYVRFFINYGGGWENLGLVAFNAHDIPNATDCAKKANKPLSYTVTLPIDPHRRSCKEPLLPEIRAILSWEDAPPEDNPNWPPVWGNVLDKNIQIKPRKPLLIEVLKGAGVDIKKLPPELIAIEKEPIPWPEPDPPPFKQLAMMYKGKVEPHRFGMPEIHAEFVPGAVKPALISNKIAVWKELKLDWAKAVEALQATKGNVSYEELTCLGLDNNRDWLEATFVVKKPTGYSSDLCKGGSTEYVAFWVDWNDTCEWTYLKTVEVKVYDIDTIPADGLHYAAILPVNLEKYRAKCTTPKIGRVRAVLSWNTPPSSTDPNKLPHWGNRLDAHVQIKPAAADGAGKAKISILGGVGIADINTTTNGMTMPLARMSPWGTFADPWGSHARECPFGGSVTVHAPPNAGDKYRIFVRRAGNPGTTVMVTNRIWVVDEDGHGSFHYADPATGFFTYLDVTQNVHNTLGLWPSEGNGLWEIRLERANAAGVVQDSTPWHKIRLDNTKPEASISIDGGACNEYLPGTPVSGKFIARDTYFGHFKLDTLPASMTPPSPTTGTPPVSAGEYQTSVTGDSWSLDTSSMVKCGYVVRVRVWDRTIRDSHPGNHNHNVDDKGFCLVE